MRILGFLFFILVSSFSLCTQAQQDINDIQKKYAFTNATIYIDSNTTLYKATMIIEGDKIIKINPLITPTDAIKIDCNGKYIYPSFIELDANISLNKIERNITSKPQYQNSNRVFTSKNDAINSNYRAIDEFTWNEKEIKKMKRNGFGTILNFNHDGIARGSGFVTFIQSPQKNNILFEDGSRHYSFNKGSSKQEYPSSFMGSVALLRQFFYDLEWYKNQNIKQDIVLNSELEHNEALPFFELSNSKQLHALTRVMKEFDFTPIIKVNNTFYQNINSFDSLVKLSFITSINAPKAINVSGPYDSRHVSLSKLHHWNLAVYNFRFMLQKHLNTAISSNGSSNFIKDLKKLYKKGGVSKNQIIDALTIIPAKILKIDSLTGSLSSGKKANFIICDFDLFENGNILENWILGKRNSFADFKEKEIDGAYTLNISGKTLKLIVQTNKAKTSLTVHINDTIYKTTLIRNENFISFHFLTNDSTTEIKKMFDFDGSIYGNGGLWEGNYTTPEGKIKRWSAIRSDLISNKEKKSPPDSVTITFKDIPIPFNSYSVSNTEKQPIIFIQNTMIWTSGEKGKLPYHDIILKNGIITQIGKGLYKPIPSLNDTLIIIDGTGLHITPGIIDEHSHIGIFGGVNEIGQNNTAEVRISDALNPNDINIYRQLAGGVTTSQLLHGSANPIGGQSALIKLKWGESATNMLVKKAPPFNKFALGENVKQSNWGENYTKRYPQTRMGVEQVFYSNFQKAKKYGENWNSYNELKPKQRSNTPAPRINLEMEALYQILENKRQITCHSYKQSEMLMLLEVADSLHFRVNTFTHALEAYKITNELKEHQTAASTFSDWWAYKFEVNDAIPYNAGVLNQKGVLTAINSDDAEMGRRLNQEAAKTIKYSQTNEIEALKMITINPAKILGIDNLTGSIELNKQADIVIWNTEPLKMDAYPVFTIIEGKIYFSKTENEKLTSQNKVKKQEILSKMKIAIDKGEEHENIQKKKKTLYHCNSEEQ